MRRDTFHQSAVAPVAADSEEPVYLDEAEPLEQAPGSGSWRPSGLLEWFAVAQTALPALLYLPGNQQSRSALRAAAFLVSIAAFAFWYLHRQGTYPVRHPATRWLLLVVGLTGYQGWLGAYGKSLAAGKRELENRTLRIMNEIPGIAVALIVVLVIVRPF